MKKGAEKEVEEKKVISAFKRSFKDIRKHKMYFLILFFTQLALLIAVSSVFVSYSIKIGENMQDIIEPLQNVSATMAPEDTADFLSNTGPINQAYSAFKKNIILMLAFSFLIYLVLGSINWDIANIIVNHHERLFFRCQLMFGISATLFTLVALFLSGIFLRFLAYMGNNALAVLIGTLMFIAVTYFSFISFSLIHKYDLEQIKSFISDSVKLGVRRFGTLFFSYSIMMLVIILFGGLVYMLLYSPLPALFASLVLFVLSMNWGKIFFLNVVKKVSRK